MPTIFTHGIVAAALVTAFPKETVPRRITTLGVLCSILPDFDVIGFAYGVNYGDFLGHRGFSHSLLFAAVVSTLALWVALVSVRPPLHRGLIWLHLFLATASHGLLDACTDGGLGIALLSPFDLTRYFFARRPIDVSPIGPAFFSDSGRIVMLSELRWVIVPALAFAAIALTTRRTLAARSAPAAS